MIVCPVALISRRPVEDDREAYDTMGAKWVSSKHASEQACTTVACLLACLLDIFSGGLFAAAAAAVEDVDVPFVAVAPMVVARPKRVRRTKQQVDAQKIIDA